MGTEIEDQVAYIQRELRARADPAKAPAMAKYMKTDMAFYGVTRPVQQQIAREARRRFPITDAADYRRLIELLWAGRHREDKYLAIEMARRWTAFIAFEHLDRYRMMIVEGAWWDFVDEIAQNIIGVLLSRDRARMRPVLDRWIDDEHLWLRRTALLSQERLRERTDAAMLFGYCERRLAEREFFIRKAIGWALRSYSKTDPAAVRDFVERHRAEMSTVSLREATKYL